MRSEITNIKHILIQKEAYEYLGEMETFAKERASLFQQRSEVIRRMESLYSLVESAEQAQKEREKAEAFSKLSPIAEKRKTTTEDRKAVHTALVRLTFLRSKLVMANRELQEEIAELEESQELMNQQEVCPLCLKKL